MAIAIFYQSLPKFFIFAVTFYPDFGDEATFSKSEQGFPWYLSQLESHKGPISTWTNSSEKLENTGLLLKH